MTGLTKLFPRSPLLAKYYLGHLPADKTNVVEVLSGAFMMVSKKVLHKVGSFDETFFMYAEDIDLSYRIQKAGYKNYYFADTTIIHFKGESTQKQQPGYVKIFYGAMAVFVKKHYSNVTSTFFSIILQAAIAAKSIQISLTNLFRNSIPKNVANGLPTQLFILSDAAVYEKMVDSLKDFDVHFAEKSMLKKATKVDALVLSESMLSFKEMIAAMEDCKEVNWFLIHAVGSTALLASNDKNRTGLTVPIKKITPFYET